MQVIHCLSSSPGDHYRNQKNIFTVTAITAEVVEPGYTGTINREGTQMTIHFHHTSRIANALFGAVSRRRVAMPNGLDRRFFADIGFIQSDIIALHTR